MGNLPPWSGGGSSGGGGGVGDVALVDAGEVDTTARNDVAKMDIWEGSVEDLSMLSQDLWLEPDRAILGVDPNYGAVLAPLIFGNLLPTTLAGAPGIEVARLVRFCFPFDGIVEDMAWLPGAQKGNFKGLAYDLGEAKETIYTQLWVGASTAVGEAKKWQLVHPNLVVRAGQELLFGLVFDNVESTYYRGTQPAEAALSTLPPGFGRGLQTQPLSAATVALNFAAPALELGNGALAGTNAPPMIGLRVVPLL